MDWPGLCQPRQIAVRHDVAIHQTDDLVEAAARGRATDGGHQRQFGVGMDRATDLAAHLPGSAYDPDADHVMASWKAAFPKGPSTVSVIGCDSTRPATARASASVTLSIRRSD